MSAGCSMLVITLSLGVHGMRPGKRRKWLVYSDRTQSAPRVQHSMLGFPSEGT